MLTTGLLFSSSIPASVLAHPLGYCSLLQNPMLLSTSHLSCVHISCSCYAHPFKLWATVALKFPGLIRRHLQRCLTEPDSREPLLYKAKSFSSFPCLPHATIRSPYRTPVPAISWLRSTVRSSLWQGRSFHTEASDCSSPSWMP